MKLTSALFWFVVSLVLGVALVVQWDQSRKRQLKLEQLQVQVEKGIAEEKAARLRVQELEKERMKLTGEMRALEFEAVRARQMAMASNSPAATQLQAALRGQGRQPGAQGAAGMGKMLGEMLKDPEMRKAMEQQQRLGLEMMYGSLFRELQLPPEQEKKFKDLLLSQQMENMSQATTMFGGAEADRSKIAEDLAAKNKQNQEELKEMLGEEKYAHYQAYNQTLSERMMLEQFGKDVALSPEQNEQLLGIIREEKQNVQINRGTEPADPSKDWQKMLSSGEAAERMYAEQEEVNSRVMERAGQMLTPEQLQKLGPLLKSQIEMQKAGMKMAQQMLGGGETAGQQQTEPVLERP